MHINKKNKLPDVRKNQDFSHYVFIYYINNRRFTLGYYDFSNNLWLDNEGMVISEDFIWCYLPIKQMRLFAKELNKNNLY